MKLGRAIPTPIRIMPTDSHGFIVDVGFATFACENAVSVLEVLREYIMDSTAFIDELEAIRGKGQSTAADGPGSLVKTPIKGNEPGSQNFNQKGQLLTF